MHCESPYGRPDARKGNQYAPDKPVDLTDNHKMLGTRAANRLQ